MSPAEIKDFGTKLVEAADLAGKLKDGQAMINKIKADAKAHTDVLSGVKAEIAKAKDDLKHILDDKAKAAKEIYDAVAAHKATIAAGVAEIKAKADAAEKKAQAQIKDEEAKLNALGRDLKAVSDAIAQAKADEAAILDRIAKAKEAAKALFQ